MAKRADLLGVFEGVLGKWVFWVWCFCGEVVVECVVNVVRWRACFLGVKDVPFF